MGDLQNPRYDYSADLIHYEMSDDCWTRSRNGTKIPCAIAVNFLHPAENQAKCMMGNRLRGNPQKSLLISLPRRKFCGFWAEIHDFETEFKKRPAIVPVLFAWDRNYCVPFQSDSSACR